LTANVAGVAASAATDTVSASIKVAKIVEIFLAKVIFLPLPVQQFRCSPHGKGSPVEG
jgi:hypothetical protein